MTRYKTKRSLEWVMSPYDLFCVIKQGEVCEYLQHNQTYVFPPRDGICPWYNTDVILNHPEIFEIIKEDKPAKPVAVKSHRRDKPKKDMSQEAEIVKVRSNLDTKACSVCQIKLKEEEIRRIEKDNEIRYLCPKCFNLVKEDK